MSRDPTESRREAVVGRSRAKNIPGRKKCKGPEVASCSVSLRNIKGLGAWSEEVAGGWLELRSGKGQAT